MSKIRMGHDPRNKTNLPILKTTQSARGLEMEKAMLEVMEAHSETFTKLAQHVALEKNTEPVVRTHTIESKETIIVKKDSVARRYAKAKTDELETRIYKSLALHNKRMDLQTEQAMKQLETIKLLSKNYEELLVKHNNLASRKPEEKHTVTEKIVVQEKLSKRILIACAATIILNILIIIAK